MQLCRVLRLKVFLLAALAVAVALGVSVWEAPQAYALDDDLVAEGAACWVTGPLGGKDMDDHDSQWFNTEAKSVGDLKQPTEEVESETTNKGLLSRLKSHSQAAVSAVFPGLIDGIELGADAVKKAIEEINDLKNHQGEDGWGGESEFTIDKSEFYAYISPTNSAVYPVNAFDFKGDLNDWGYFASYVDAVDFTFAMSSSDLAQYSSVPESKGRDLYYLMYELGFVPPPELPGSRPFLPFSNQRSYAFRQATADYKKNVVRTYSADWHDPYDPEGGSTFDAKSFLGDSFGAQANIAAATTRAVDSGSRLLVESGIDQVTLIDGANAFICTPGGSCEMKNTMTTRLADANFFSTTVDTSQAETFGSDINPMAERSLSVDKSVPAGAIAYVDRSAYGSSAGGGYGVLTHEDTPTDQIRVSIELDSTYRKDFKWKLVDSNNFSEETLAAFGPNENAWAHPNFNGEPPFLTSGPSTTNAPDVVFLKEGDPGPLPAPKDVEHHLGYRQSTLSGTAYEVYNPTIADDEGNIGNVIGPVTSGAYVRAMDKDRAPKWVVLDGNAVPDPSRPYSWQQIRWPVNLADLNWYLYDLPGYVNDEGQGSDTLAFWMSHVGSEWLLGSGYGQTISGLQLDVGEPPVCEFADIDPVPGGKPGDGGKDGLMAVQSLAQAVCSSPKPPDTGDLVDGKLKGVYYPFEVNRYLSDHEAYVDEGWIGGTVSNPAVGTLDHYSWKQGDLPLVAYRDFTQDRPSVHARVAPVRAGVVRPFDYDGVGPREMNRFSFTINEELEISDSSLGKSGVYHVKRHYGVPLSRDYAHRYYEDWPNDPINPNRPYLLVATFYEALHDQARTFVSEDGSFEIEGRPVKETGIRFPERHIRRVICRMMVYPSGFSPIASESRSVVGKLFSELGDQVLSVGDKYVEYLKLIFRTFSLVPAHATQETVGASCDGIVLVENLTSSDKAPPLTTVNGSGQIAVNRSGIDRDNTLRDCERNNSETVSTCAPGTNALIGGDCIDLPRMELKIVPEESLFYGFPKNFCSGIACDTAIEEHAVCDVEDLRKDKIEFYPLPDPLENLNSSNAGVADIRLDIDYKYASVGSGPVAGIDGFMIEIIPDQKVVDANCFRLDSNGTMIYLVPKYFVERISHQDGPICITPVDCTRFAQDISRNVHGFNVGSFNQAIAGSRAFIKPYVIWDEKLVVQYAVYGDSVVQDHFEQINYVLGQMPLAPGYSHKFRVASFKGIPSANSEGFVGGPWSGYVELNGDNAACHALRPDSAVGEADSFSDEQTAALRKQYKCPAYQGKQILVEPASEDFRIGLLNLAGSNLCGDIFSTTPSMFTWDNEVVKRFWLLMWVIAGSVFFVLFVWQAFRMTYDLWLDPRPSTGFREMVPRFLAAIVLAASSLLLCKWVLILASDITCFVAHLTGMTMWGVIGNTFLLFASGFGDLLSEWITRADYSLPSVLMLKIFVAGLVVLFLMIFMLILFLKIAFQMLIRLIMLAVLIVFAPLAFAFYASDSTSHWTKKWVSMFLGTTFQQVIVLLVLYLGVSLVKDYTEAGQDSMYALLVGMFLALMALAAAERVPKLVNPVSEGAGLFEGFKSTAMMAAAGTALVVGAVAGGAAGGLGAVGGGAAAAGGGGAAAVGGGGTATVGGAPAAGAMSSLPSAPAAGGGRSFGQIMSDMGRGAQRGMRVADSFNRRAENVVSGDFLKGNAMHNPRSRTNQFQEDLQNSNNP